MRLRLLVSYHYHRDTDLDAIARVLGGPAAVDFFADSGAYSAATLGTTIALDDYAAWLTHWAPLLTVQAGLDVIGDHEATAANTERLRQAGCDPLPVFHTGEPWPVLEEMCARHAYVALGGLALHAAGGHKHTALMRWLVKAFRIAQPHGTRFHGFGVTSTRLVTQLPFYSVDSSSYTLGRRFGLAYLWDERHHRIRDVFFRNPADARRHAALMRGHGLDPARTIAEDFMRAGTPARETDARAVTAASVHAYRLMERHLTATHHVTAPAGLPGPSEPGTKVYLALNSPSEQDTAPFLAARRIPGAP